MTRHFRTLTLIVILPVLALQVAAQSDAGLRARAAGGDAAAMQQLGRSYVQAGDSVEAYTWLTLAADRGLESPERANLFNTMTTAQFTDASRRLGDIRATLPREPSEPIPMPVKPVTAESKPAAAHPPAVAVSKPPAVADTPKQQPSTEKPADDSKARIAKLESDLAAARAEARIAKAEVSASDGKHDNELARVTGERDALASRIAALGREKSRAEEARDHARVELAAARARLDIYSGVIREGAPADSGAVYEALRQSEMKVDMTVRAFAVIEQENDRLQARVREAEVESAEAVGRAGGEASETARVRSELARSEQTRNSANAAREAIQRDLVAAQIRSDNLARELRRARPDMPVYYSEPAASAPTAPRAAPAAAESADDEARIHVVADGENLSVISNRYYNSPHRWIDIYNANRDVMKSENHVVPGMKLRIP